MVSNDFKVTISTKEIEKILQKVQNLEPVGCGYRDITESLLVQIEHLDISENEKENIKKIILQLASGQINLEDIEQHSKTLIRNLSSLISPFLRNLGFDLSFKHFRDFSNVDFPTPS